MCVRVCVYETQSLAHVPACALLLSRTPSVIDTFKKVKDLRFSKMSRLVIVLRLELPTLYSCKELADYSQMIKSGLLLVFTNKVMLEDSHTHIKILIFIIFGYM